MDLRRLRAGEWIAALAGAALLLSLFLPWYRGPEPPCPAGGDCPAGTALSGWEALAVSDAALAAIGTAAILLLVVTATQRVPAVPIALAAFVTLLGIAATVLVLVRAGWLPEGAAARAGAVWLALAGAGGIAAGGLVAMRDERLSRPDRLTDSSGRPTAPPPDAPPIPAPRP